MKRVVVTIDRLVLKGFRYEDRHAIAQGLQEQLAQLLSEPGMAERIRSVGDLPRLKVAAIVAPQECLPKKVGSQVAQGIGEGLKS